eukprot:1230222-Karenia_brevis.AAC.1
MTEAHLTPMHGTSHKGMAKWHENSAAMPRGAEERMITMYGIGRMGSDKTRKPLEHTQLIEAEMPKGIVNT